MISAFERGLGDALWPRSATELAAAGVTREMTRGSAWRRTSRGFFAPSTVPDSTTQRILDVAPLIPASGALGGWAAAYVLGVDVLDGLDPFTMTRLPLAVHLGGDLGRANLHHVRYVRERLSEIDRQIRHGLAVTAPLRTAFDGARWAPNLVEAVVFLDQVGHVLRLDLTLLDQWCVPGARWPGVRQLREALLLADSASASPWETRLRMFYVTQAGLPRPKVNRPVFSPEGNLLGVADLLDVEAGLVTEFDGQDHRLRRQHRADNIREERLETANLVVCRVDSLDLRSPLALSDRLRARWEQGMRRDRRQDRWTLVEPAWWRRRRAA